MEMKSASAIITIILKMGFTLGEKDETVRRDRYYWKAKETGKLVPTETVAYSAGVCLIAESDLVLCII